MNGLLLQTRDVNSEYLYAVLMGAIYRYKINVLRPS